MAIAAVWHGRLNFFLRARAVGLSVVFLLRAGAIGLCVVVRLGVGRLTWTYRAFKAPTVGWDQDYLRLLGPGLGFLQFLVHRVNLVSYHISEIPF